MKTFAYTTVSLLFTFSLLYLPISFAAWSFNPHEWNHTERFIFAFFFMISIGYALVKPFIPKAIFKV